MSSCSKLPQEVLQCIVEHVNSNPKAPNKKDLMAMQLVCKNWSKPAQAALYQQVALAQHARSFAATITKAPHIGSMVNTIRFLDGLDMNKIHLQEILLAIVKYCVNVKHIWSYFLQQTSNMMAFLLSEHNNITGLESLKTWNQSDFVDPITYEEVALRYRNTMKHLHLTYQHLDYETREFIDHRELESKLHLFPALQQLDIDKHIFRNVEYTDQMLDSCPSSLSGLYVKEWYSVKDAVVPPQDTIKPNTTIIKLTLKTARTSTETMRYLAIKFKGLKELYARFETLLSSAETIEEWWQHLHSISLGLTKYAYGIELSSYQQEESGVDQLNRCLVMAQKTAPATCSRHFTLKYCCEACYDSDMDSILISRSPNSYHLTLDQRDADDFYLPDLVRSLQQLYLPDSIHLMFESFDLVYRQLAYTGESDSYAGDDDTVDLGAMSYDFVPAQQVKKAFDGNMKPLWEVFTSFLALLDPIKNQDICVQNMVVFKQKPENLPVVSRVSNITFQSCILEHSALPTISQCLPTVDCMVFDTTCILMDEPYNLKLHLPYSKIHTLKVVIRPLVEALENFYYGYDYLTCKLENKELLDAISSQYTLKIETKSKTYISKRKGNKIIEDNCDDVATGTHDNFLIWIKCKELTQCLVTSNQASKEFELIK